MLKMSLSVVVMSVKRSAMKSYGTFGFTGGMVNCSISPGLVDEVESNKDKEIQGVFQMLPRMGVVFSHTKSVFEVVELLEIVPGEVANVN